MTVNPTIANTTHISGHSDCSGRNTTYSGNGALECYLSIPGLDLEKCESLAGRSYHAKRDSQGKDRAKNGKQSKCWGMAEF